MHLVLLHLLFKSTCLTASEQVISKSLNHGGARPSGGAAGSLDGECDPHPVKGVTESDWLAHHHAKEVSIPDLSQPCRSYKDNLGSVLLHLVKDMEQKGKWRKSTE